jgi:hypothetical protein
VAVYTFDPENIEEHQDVYHATLARLNETHAQCASQMLEGVYPDDPDWKPVRLSDWSVVRARKFLEAA